MLPDFPTTKRLLRERLYELSDRRTEQYLGLWGKVGRHQLHEGKGQLLTRDDGSKDDSESIPIMVPIHFTPEECESLTMEQLIGKVDNAAREMAARQTDLFGKRFEETVTEAGTAVNTQGLDGIETFFKLLDTVDLCFSKDGSPDFPQIVQPNGQLWFDQTKARIERDPALASRYRLLIEAKKEDFRDREARRKLVG